MRTSTAKFQMKLFAISALIVCSSSSVQADVPFWKKSENQRKMRDDRAVLVNVTSESGKQGNQPTTKFRMRGAGFVNREASTAFKIAQQYPRLKEVSDHFKTVTWDEKRSSLFLITEALGYQARMILKITPTSSSLDKNHDINWEVVWGHFQGMKGKIGFERLDHRTTEVTFLGDYEAAELPLPKILMGFALEIITQKVAERMRTFLEKEPAPMSKPVSSN